VATVAAGSAAFVVAGGNNAQAGDFDPGPGVDILPGTDGLGYLSRFSF
jgi:hypothetical protein